MVTTEIKSGFLHESNKDLIFNCQLQILNLSLFPLGVDSEREDQGLSLYASVGLILTSFVTHRSKEKREEEMSGESKAQDSRFQELARMIVMGRLLTDSLCPKDTTLAIQLATVERICKEV